MQFERWREEFPACERVVHFNHAGVSPVPTRVARAITRFAEQATGLDGATHRAWEEHAEVVRASCARLIGATAAEVAFVKNTSEGVSLVAGGLAWRGGDNVVAIDEDYPSNVYPWWGLRRFGVATRMVKPRGGRFDVDAIRPAVDARTRVVAVSAVDWQTGFRCDLGALGAFCRERGVLLCVDGIQAVGAMQLAVARDAIDCLAVGGHKWLLAPQGCGFLFVSQRVVEQLQPVLLGWNSVADAGRYLPYHFALRADARRFEPGTPSYLGIHALGAALELLHEVGPATIEARVLDVTAQLADGLRRRGAEIVSPMGAGERSGILTFRLGGNPSAVAATLLRGGIVCRVRAGGVRLAPHFYNDETDVARFFAALDEAGKP